MPLETYYEAKVTPTDDSDTGLRVRVQVTTFIESERETIRADIEELMTDYPEWTLTEHFHPHNERISCRDLKIWRYQNGIMTSFADLEPEGEV